MTQTVITLLFTSLMLLIAVSFYTLLERKVLGLGHMRLGPDVVSAGGLFQPFSDGLKLFTKELLALKSWSYGVYWLAPGLLLVISFLYATLIPSSASSMGSCVSLILLLVLMGVSVYPLLWVGWSPSSSWALLGAVRSLSQTVSYEASLSFLLIVVICLIGGTGFSESTLSTTSMASVLVGWAVLWLLSVLAELNRTPFDLGEAESELVSGVNIEYSGGTFGVLFISEYFNMIVLSVLSSALLTGAAASSLISAVFSGLLIYLLVWVRVTLPRCRYDKLMLMCWSVVLPIAMFMLFVVLVLVS